MRVVIDLQRALRHNGSN